MDSDLYYLFDFGIILVTFTYGMYQDLIYMFLDLTIVNSIFHHYVENGL